MIFETASFIYANNDKNKTKELQSKNKYFSYRVYFVKNQINR
jgi:hypothetical protein